MFVSPFVCTTLCYTLLMKWLTLTHPISIGNNEFLLQVAPQSRADAS